MSEAYQYAVWRVVPDVARGEAINAGIVLHCPRLRFLAARVALDADRLRALAPAADTSAVTEALEQRAALAAGAPESGALAPLPASERFGLLVAPASTVVQPGPVHTGLCEDPQEVLAQLFAGLVAAP